MIVETTINAQTKNYLKEKKLAELIKKMEFDKEYMVQIFNFFTDVHLQDVQRFIIAYGITEKNIKDFYEKYVKPYYPNKQLEEMFENA
ncbi:hypothetical protein SAMN05660826_01310 [Caldanaerovirga acetigignens]|uniref:Uncharacterized protein n=1 Tax=Caldanaerovirga acetigignens TaxID=447595 RepID=A0A1M7JRA9_9FIRM|nr:hypothetical protein [Caldanaerovirga acetigignens]SHM55528.1 hypothetical protein SAMN05660826_01310 [Caldanaerovirga acetigignens]